MSTPENQLPTLPKIVDVTVPTHPIAQNRVAPQHQVTGAFPHGTRWAACCEAADEAPFRVLPNMNRQFPQELQQVNAPQFFLRVRNAPHLALGAPIAQGEISVFRFNIFGNRLIYQTIITGGVADVPEIHTAYPVLLPSGRFPQACETVRVLQWRNVVEANVQTRPLVAQAGPMAAEAQEAVASEAAKAAAAKPAATDQTPAEKSEIQKQEGPNATSQLNALRTQWLDTTGFAPDWAWNQNAYVAGDVNQVFYTAIANHCVLEPTTDCNFGIEAQIPDGKQIIFTQKKGKNNKNQKVEQNSNSLDKTQKTPLGQDKQPEQTKQSEHEKQHIQELPVSEKQPEPETRQGNSHGLDRGDEKSKQEDKEIQEKKEIFEGIVTLPSTFNPLQETQIFGVIEEVNACQDQTSFGAPVWILTVNVGGVRMEMLSLRNKMHTGTLDSTTATEPKVGQRFYAHAAIQTFSAKDPRNVAGYQAYPPVGPQPALIPDPQQQAAVGPAGIPAALQAAAVVPNRFFLHTKHILNRVEGAVFQNTVLVRLNPEGFGCMFNFPAVAQTARLVNGQQNQNAVPGNAAPGNAAQQPPAAVPSHVVASVLARAQRPIEPLPLPDPAPIGRTELSQPHPQLLEALDSAFQNVREYLTLRELIFIGRVSKQGYNMAFNDGIYWTRRLRTLCIGPHISIPANDEISTDTKRRWYKTLYLQQQLAHHKRQLDLDLVTADQLEEPVRSQTVQALTNQFRNRFHQCGLCTQNVPYAVHLDKGLKKVIDIVHMTCDPCHTTKLWSSKAATLLWGIPIPSLRNVPAWRLPTTNWYTTNWYTTEDLLEAFVNHHAPLLTESVFETKENAEQRSLTSAEEYERLLEYLKSNNVPEMIQAPFEQVINFEKAKKERRNEMLGIESGDTKAAAEATTAAAEETKATAEAMETAEPKAASESAETKATAETKAAAETIDSAGSSKLCAPEIAQRLRDLPPVVQSFVKVDVKTEQVPLFQLGDRKAEAEMVASNSYYVTYKTKDYPLKAFEFHGLYDIAKSKQQEQIKALKKAEDRLIAYNPSGSLLVQFKQLEAQRKEEALRIEAQQKEEALRLEAQQKEEALRLETQRKEDALLLEAQRMEAQRKEAEALDLALRNANTETSNTGFQIAVAQNVEVQSPMDALGKVNTLASSPMERSGQVDSIVTETLSTSATGALATFNVSGPVASKVSDAVTASNASGPASASNTSCPTSASNTSNTVVVDIDSELDGVIKRQMSY